jgi:pseudaminic acid biosynthesis-associated methylase
LNGRKQLMVETSQLQRWKGDFGNDYIGRNVVSRKAVDQRLKTWGTMFDHMSGVDKLLEVGSNIGLNLHAITQLTKAEIHAVEPNDTARQTLVDSQIIPNNQIHSGNAFELPFEDNSFDLVYTSGVLIHIAPEDLEKAYKEIHRVSRKYVLSIELFSQKPEVIHYRGHDDLLFKRDFGGLWLDTFSDMKPIAEGFFWKRTTGLDDCTWWLFEV